MAKFYMHFKGKPYRFLGIAKYSENLEEMVVYETMYENPEGRLWVRPRRMFEETVERDGKVVRRFAPVAFEYRDFNVLPPMIDLTAISKLSSAVIGPLSLESVQRRLESNPNFLIQTCKFGERLIGFKIGYTKSKDTFYSWVGGVDPEYRRLGIAAALIEQQHAWCKARGFKIVETKTTNDYPGMIVLNIQSGYKIQKTVEEEDSRLKILMAKTL